MDWRFVLMGLVEGMNKIFGVECDECSVPFPKSMLVTFRCVGFSKYDGRYCASCYQKIAKNFGFCDECGDEFPKEHLYRSLVDKTALCKNCLIHEETMEFGGKANEI
jgi:predicted amidophosphoribosyltransferase